VSAYAVRATCLSKEYEIGRLRHNSLRDAASAGLSAPIRRLRGEAYRPKETSRIWALEDVSFEIAGGEAVGIIGANGAGKSTLLKILSRIVEPTRGEARIRGRVGSLLEVGTGFHSELTGRENVFLNGAILGMKKTEIAQKFDDIVDFADVAKFIDTPVKRYSSGMFVRLAFAVASQLEPEILIVDEVLSVGDAAFQKRCLGKMGDVASEGRTVIFVSHSMAAVSALCSRVLLLDTGRLVADGPVAEVTHLYQAGVHPGDADGTDVTGREHYGSGRARFVSLEIVPETRTSRPASYLHAGDSLLIRTRIRAVARVDNANAAVIVYDANGYRVIDVSTALAGSFVTIEPGEDVVVTFRLYDLLLKPGTYLVGLWLGRGSLEDIDGILYASSFPVEADPAAIMHSETFPGVYQCRFSHDITHMRSGQHQEADAHSA
jgi:lipopolysaccharide transport system ATP-binding protein